MLQPAPAEQDFFWDDLLEYSPDQQRLAIGSTGRETVTLWDANTYERLITLPSSAQVSLLRFSPDGAVIAGQPFSGAQAGTVFFWRAPSWEEIEKAEAASNPGN